MDLYLITSLNPPMVKMFIRFSYCSNRRQNKSLTRRYMLFLTSTPHIALSSTRLSNTSRRTSYHTTWFQEHLSWTVSSTSGVRSKPGSKRNWWKIRSKRWVSCNSSRRSERWEERSLLKKQRTCWGLTTLICSRCSLNDRKFQIEED